MAWQLDRLSGRVHSGSRDRDKSEGSQDMNETFHCDCGGPTRTISAERVEHACAHKYAALTSYYDGIERFVPRERVRINPAYTNGEVRFNWYVAYVTA